MFTTSDRESLTGNYNTRNITPCNTFLQRVIDNVVLLVIGGIALAVAYAIATSLV